MEEKPEASAWVHACGGGRLEHPKVVVVDDDMVTVIRGEHLDHMVHELLVNHDQYSMHIDIGGISTLRSSWRLSWIGMA